MSDMTYQQPQNFWDLMHFALLNWLARNGEMDCWYGKALPRAALGEAFSYDGSEPSFQAVRQIRSDTLELISIDSSRHRKRDLAPPVIATSEGIPYP